MGGRQLLAAAVLAGALTGCSGAQLAASSAPAPTPQPTGTVWLCRPGTAADPCAANLTTTIVPASGPRRVLRYADATSPPADCFYVYPTVSAEAGPNADLTVQPAEVAAAVTQAAQFARVCRVWAPIYRQRTVSDLFAVGSAAQQAADVAYASLLAGWRDYLAHDNHGRPVVFLGHSQGAAVLIRLLREQVDPDPALRRRVVVAILAGGNVTVPSGRTVGGSFQHLPLCTAPAETGCVIAYSAFGSQPPPGAFFGRPGIGVSLMSGQTRSAGMQVACVDPAAIGGGPGRLLPLFPRPATEGTPGSTRWLAYPDRYRAECRTGGGASWLQVDPITAPGDARPTVRASLGPAWGYHLDDVNLPLGNLVADVAAEEAAYRAVRS